MADEALDKSYGVANRALCFEIDDLGSPVSFNVPDVEIHPKYIPKTRNIDGSVTRRVSVTPDGDAIVIRDAFKAYSLGRPVLNGLNMTVPCASIYGLLGSSGCGKTTVLSCIVGLNRLDQGTILIFGSEPGTKSIGVPGSNVGYMPQDISLCTEFSIAETLCYFGTLSGMTWGDIKKARDALVAIFDLPEESRRVGTLSGGQMRRVSLVAALLASPQLLILDEPTAGVDPLTRIKIWEYLKTLVTTRRSTVIITTHYIDECRSADNIGILRNGRLLEEGPPNLLMEEHGSDNLEEIILRLSRMDVELSLSSGWREVRQSSNKIGSPPNTSISREENFKGPPPKLAKILHEQDKIRRQNSYARIIALTLKNLIILYRNLLFLLFVIGIGAAILAVLCIALGNDPRELPLGLVNNDANYSRDCPNITRALGECSVEFLSCHFLSNLDKETIVLKPYESENDALNAVLSGENWGYILFPDNFSEMFYERATSQSDSEDVLNSSTIFLRLDESNKQISVTIKKALANSFQDFIAQFLQDCGFDPRQGESLLKYHYPAFGNDTTNFREFLAPGMAIPLMFFFSVITTSIRFIKEKNTGVFYRSIVGGVKAWEITIAYSISEFFVLISQSILSYIVMRIFFNVTIMGSHFLLFLTFLISGYKGVSLGFFLGSMCTQEIQAALLTMATIFPNVFLAGVFWPTQGMPLGLQYVAMGLPCTLLGEAARSICSRGWEFTHSNVWPGFAVTAGYILGFFVLTVLFHKK